MAICSAATAPTRRRSRRLRRKSVRQAGDAAWRGRGAFVLTAPGAVAAPLARTCGVRARGPLQRAPALSTSDELALVEQALRDAEHQARRCRALLVGANGDPALDEIYAQSRPAPAAPGRKAWRLACIRHLTGDFATASALGFELAVRAVAGRAVPSEVRVVGGEPDRSSACCSTREQRGLSQCH